MAFDDKQKRALTAKLRYRNVKTRAQNGSRVHYIEGWRAIAEANRIFGYDSWDRQTVAPECLWSERQRGQIACLYSSKVRITVRAGGTVTVREGIGTGFGRAANTEAAHEIALKAAETDATKRALATFGNPFGLALYDKDQSQVTKPAKKLLPAQETSARPAGPSSDLVLTHSKGRSERFAGSEAFVEATLNAVPKLKTTAAVYAFWEANLLSFTALRAQAGSPDHDPVQTIVSSLKARIRALGRATNSNDTGAAAEKASPERRLAIPKERRIRDQAHLAFVARHSCLVCGRQPAQAHHIRFAQPRAMGMKVSDEFAVPLCNGHHDAVHRTGDERAWWAARHIDPLAIAEHLWSAIDKTKEIPLGGPGADTMNGSQGGSEANAKPVDPPLIPPNVEDPT